MGNFTLANIQTLVVHYENQKANKHKYIVYKMRLTVSQNINTSM